MQVPKTDEDPRSQSTVIQETIPMVKEDSGGSAQAATFEERFEQFYLQLSEGKTGGMVVREIKFRRVALKQPVVLSIATVLLKRIYIHRLSFGLESVTFPPL